MLDVGFHYIRLWFAYGNKLIFFAYSNKAHYMPIVIPLDNNRNS